MGRCQGCEGVECPNFSCNQIVDFVLKEELRVLGVSYQRPSYPVPSQTPNQTHPTKVSLLSPPQPLYFLNVVSLTLFTLRAETPLSPLCLLLIDASLINLCSH